MSEISQMTANAIQAGAHPAVLALAGQLLGKKAYIGYCQQFVEQMTGNSQKSASAIQAWNNAQNKVQGLNGVQPGDLVYFSPNASNKGFGHTGIYQGNNKFISATDSGIMSNDLQNWIHATGQNILGYIPQGQRQPQQTLQKPNTQQPQQQTLQRPISMLPTQQPVSSPQSPISNPLSTIMGSQTPQNSTTFGNITVPNIR